MDCVLGIDLGTSSVKAALYDSALQLIGEEEAPYAFLQPRNGWAEQVPEDWYKAAICCIHSLLERTKCKPDAISLTGQMNGLVALDAHKNPVYNAILWCDQRGSDILKIIDSQLGKELLLQETYNPLLSGFSLVKLLWLREHESQQYQKICHILPPKDYLRLRFTGLLATDYSDASGMQLLDAANQRWSSLVLDTFKIRRSILPELYESTMITGFITPEAARETGLTEGTPVIAGGGDNITASIGTGIFNSDDAMITIGSSGILCIYMSHPLPDRRIHIYCSGIRDHWLAICSTQTAGMSLKWIADQLFANDSNRFFSLTETAKSASLGSAGLFCIPYLMGDRTPHMDADARGILIGISPEHSHSVVSRSMFEGIAYSFRDGFEIIRSMGIDCRTIRIGGGGAMNPFWMQMFADVLNTVIVTSSSGRNNTVLGASILGIVGSKMKPDISSVEFPVDKSTRYFIPNSGNHIEYDRLYRFYQSAYPHFESLFHDLSTMK